MWWRYGSLVLALTTLLTLLISFAQATEAQKCVPGKKCGYWWYEDPKKEEKKKEEKKEVVQKEEKKRRLPSLKDYTEEQLWKMHPDDFQALVEEFKKKAIMTLDPKDVYEYYVIVDIGRRKALAFAQVADYVLTKHPELNVASVMPIAVPGRVETVKMRRNVIEKTIREAQKDFGLLYFYSPDCPYCKVQDGVLQYFIKQYGWEVKYIDINKEPRLASMFNIQVTPTIILVYKYNTKDYLPISAGVVSLEEMETKIYRGIRLFRGEITPEQWATYEFELNTPLDPKRRIDFNGIK